MKDWITRIFGNVAAAQFNASARGLDAGFVALSDDTKIVDVLERMGRARYHRATFEADTLEDFVRFMKEESSHGRMTIFISDESIVGYPDFGRKDDPSLRNVSARFDLRFTSEWEAMLALTTKSSVSQSTLHDFLLDYGRCCVAEFMRGKDVLEKDKVIYALTHIKASSVQEHCSVIEDTSQHRSMLESISIDSEEALPDLMVIETDVFKGVDVGGYCNVRIAPQVIRDEVHFRLIAQRYDDEIEQVKKLMLTDTPLADLNEQGAEIYFGSAH